jgi:hypothetical protein
MRRGVMEQMVSLISLGDGSTLTLDFTTGVLDSRLSFSRSTGGSYVHSDGLLYGFDTSSSSNTIGTGSKTFTIAAPAAVNRRYSAGDLIIASSGANNMSGSVTSYDPATQSLVCNMASSSGSGTFTAWIIGNRQPRFDHDPTTLAPRGLLVEASATNLVTQSNGATSVWTIGGNRTPTNNTTDLLSPDGTNNATKLVCGTATSYASHATTITGLTGGGTYTVSYWIRGPVGHTPRLYALNGTIGDVTPTATTGTYNNTGWTRLTQTYTLPATTTQVYVYFMSVTVVVTGDTFYVYGFQLETGSGASSLIPTGASTATRNADNCELLDLSTMAFNASAGTIYTDVGTRLNTGSQRNYTFLPASGGNNQIFEGSGIAFNVFSSGSFVAQIGTSTLAAQKIAAAYALNDYAVSVAGGAVSTDTSGALPSGLTKLTIGGSIINSAAYMNGCIRVFKYWPTRLPNATLQSLTT